MAAIASKTSEHGVPIQSIQCGMPLPPEACIHRSAGKGIKEFLERIRPEDIRHNRGRGELVHQKVEYGTELLHVLLGQAHEKDYVRAVPAQGIGVSLCRMQMNEASGKRQMLWGVSL